MNDIKFKFISTESELKDFNEWVYLPKAGIDIETASESGDGALEPWDGWISTIQITDAETEATLIIDAQEIGVEALKRSWVKELIEDPTTLKIAHNAKFEIKWFMYHLDAEPEAFFDTMLASQMIAAGDVSAKHDLGSVAAVFTSIELDKGEQTSDWSVRPLSDSQLRYAAWDAAIVPPIYVEQVKRLEADDLTRVATIEFDVIKPIARTELNGLHLDQERWSELLVEKKAKLAILHDEMLEMLQAGVDWTTRNKEKHNATARPRKPEKPVNPRKAKANRGREVSTEEMLAYEKALSDYEWQLIEWGNKFAEWEAMPSEIPATLNPNSHDQIKRALYNVTGLRLGSTQETFLTPFADKYPQIAKLIEYRGAAKSVSSYGDNFLEKAQRDGRVHTSFKQILDTGRMSSREPNIQQIPHDEAHRRCFTAPRGRKLVIADYSQIQLRFLAEFSADPAFVGDFNSGVDLHIKGASRFLGVRVEDVDKEMRNGAKRTNFGVVFGIQGEKLGRQIGKEAWEAQKLIDAYFDTYRGNAAWLKKADFQARTHLFARTMAGRIQRFSHDGSRGQISAIGRNGMNMPIQGCITGDSQILTKEFGMTPIQSVVNQGVTVWNGTNFVGATVAESGIKQLVKIHLSGRKEINVSPTHKFLVVGTTGVEKWVEAQNLRPTDRIRFSDTPGQWSSNILFPTCVSGSTGNAGRACFNDFSGDLFDLGVWLGRIASDGFVSPEPRGEVKLFVAEHEKAILPFLESVTGKITPYKVRTVMKEHYNYPVYHIDIYDLGLTRQLRELKERIPAYIFANSDLLRGYLRGFFDGDGTVSRDGASLKFGYEHAKLEWVKQFQSALGMLGIRSNISLNGNSIGLSVRKADSAIFAKTIGFLNPVKQRKLEAVTVSDKHQAKGVGRVINVKSVEITDEFVPMYDVVNSESHTFSLEGLVTHNSEADMMKRALYLLDLEIRGTNVLLVNVVHDEIVLEAPEEQAEWASEILTSCMIRAGREFIKLVEVPADAIIADEWIKE